LEIGRLHAGGGGGVYEGPVHGGVRPRRGCGDARFFRVGTYDQERFGPTRFPISGGCGGKARGVGDGGSGRERPGGRFCWERGGCGPLAVTLQGPGGGGRILVLGGLRYFGLVGVGVFSAGPAGEAFRPDGCAFSASGTPCLSVKGMWKERARLLSGGRGRWIRPVGGGSAECGIGARERGRSPFFAAWLHTL